MSADKLTNPLKRWTVEKKLGILLFLTHLDVCLRRGHNERHYGIDEDERKLSIEGTTKPYSSYVPDLGPKWRLYRQFTNFIHLCNGLKYALIAIMMDGTLLPLESNCYLLGRMFSHHDVAHYIFVLALAMSLFHLVWRYTFLVSKRSFEMNILVFLLHDESTTELEVARIVQLEDSPYSSVGMREDPSCQSVLQDALCYPLMEGRSRIGYRLRPNRTEECRRKLHTFFDRIVLFLLMTILGYAIATSPTVLVGCLNDATYIRAYPRCCPYLEQMASNGTLSSTQISFDSCPIKQVSLIFDLVDNLTIYFDSYIALVMPSIVAALVTYDLSTYWQVIDVKTKYLLERLRCYNTLYTNKLGLYRTNFTHIRSPRRRSQLVMEHRKFLRVHPEPSDIHLSHAHDIDNYINELQSLLCDFFECVRRADKFICILLTFFSGLYLLAMLVFGFVGWRIDNLYDIFIARFLFVSANINFIVSSSMTLRLKHMIDRSYVDLCSIMAQDRSRMKIRWMKMIEYYTPGARDSFTVMKSSRFTWMFVLNLIASVMSYLLALETYKS